MAATLEIKYFNTFWLKKLTTVVDASPQPTVPGAYVPGGDINATPVIAPYAATTATDWYIEESRIRGGYNNTTVDFGVKAYLDEKDPKQQDRFNTMIYSGIFNSRTGTNNTNQFSVGEDITRSADPANGSIQRLYAEDTNLIIFQERKVSRALIDKDAIYSAEGNSSITSTQKVMGQIIAYVGEYGISKDPFSFAVYGYRKYFTDRNKGCILRLSRDGITEISSYGMHDFFRDELSAASTNKVVGSWDIHTKNYVVSIQGQYVYKTLSFDESVLGWTSLFSYKPNYITSLNSNFYSFKDGKVYTHHTGNYGKFYGVTSDSTVELVLNFQPSVVKNFQTINYEGGLNWQVDSMISSSGDQSVSITPYIPPSATSLNTLALLESNMFATNFKRKENKYFANLQQNIQANVVPQPGEVLWGGDISGIKGFFATVTMKLINSDVDNQLIKRELFSVSSDFVESSY